VLRAQRAAHVRDGTSEHRLRALVERSPGLVSGWVALANFLDSRDRLAEAAECYRTAIGLDPAFAELWLGLAHAVKDTDPVAAHDCFIAAITLAPRFAAGHRDLSWFLQARGEVEAAYQRMECAVRLHPNDQANLFEAAKFYAHTGDFEAANHLYLRAIAAFRCDHEVRMAYARFCWLRGDHERADEYFLEALRFGDRDPELNGTYGAFQHQVRKDLPRASYFYQRALSFAPTAALVKCNLGGLMCEAGDTESGLQLIGEALADGSVSRALRLEGEFFRFVHERPQDRPAARAEVLRLLDEGVRSPEWNFSVHVQIAAQDASHRPAEAAELAQRINQRQG
jgi:Tfp pilus assembly protein PilF